MEQKTLKEWALYYASIGWKVFPLVPGDKIPIKDSNGFKDATTDKEQIEKWWSQDPKYNIGIATGAQSGGLVVVDLDEDETKKPIPKHGMRVFDKWGKDHNLANTIFRTLICNSPRGGMHLYYHSNAPYQNQADIVWGIDVRAEGGYIVAPPSIHPNGKRYMWNDKQGIGQIKPAEITPLLGSFIVNGDEAYEENPERKRKKNNTKNNNTDCEIVPEGQRVGTLVSKIGELVAKGLDNETIKLTIQAYNKTHCKPPLTDKELDTQVLTALNRGWSIPGDPQEIPELQPISANALLQMDIAPLKFVIKDICPAGFGILAAPPKYYKSFLALQICAAVSQGDQVLNKDTTKTKCLYFDLESTNRRPKSRLAAMGFTSLDNVDFITQDQMPKVKSRMINLSTGFAEMLERYLKNNPDYGFVVIDVFKKIRSEQKRTQSLYDHDYADIETLQAIAARNNVCLLLLHHTNKMKDETDPFNNMNGSNGLLGAADFAWVIGREKRSATESILHITGRDIESYELSVKFNTNTLKWEYNGTVEDVQAQREMDDYLQSNLVNTIKTLVNTNNGSWSGTASAIISASRYFNTTIYDSSTKVGKDITKYSDLLYVEANITIDKDKSKDSKRERIYIFKKVK